MDRSEPGVLLLDDRRVVGFLLRPAAAGEYAAGRIITTVDERWA